MPKKPIAHEVRRLIGNELVGWSIYIEDYERAVEKLTAIYCKNVNGKPDGGAVADLMRRAAREHLAALGITLPRALRVTGARRDATTTPKKRPGRAIVAVPGQRRK